MAEPSDASPARLLAGLCAACERALGQLPPGPRMTADDLCRLLEQVDEPLVLCLDDLHVLRGTASETELERLIAHLPPGVRILAATRRRPDINLSRLLVAGDLLELHPDDLRFRSWEVEELFRDIYGEPLPPGDLAVLARRTEGWAAGLQLFHLACRGRSPAERRRLLASLGTHFALASEYLARNVLADLEPDLSDFLLQTCVLGQLTGELCDELLDSTGSQARLAALAERQVFTRALDEHGGTYRYHEVLRRHLELELVERIGEAEARERFRRAGTLLERRGALADAIRAQCRAEDWESVARLAAREGEHLLAIGDGWLDLLPASMRQDDPWLCSPSRAASARPGGSTRRSPPTARPRPRSARRRAPSSRGASARRSSASSIRWLPPASTWRASSAPRRCATRRPPRARRACTAPSATAPPASASCSTAVCARPRRRLEDARSGADVPPMIEAVATSGLAAALLLSGRTDDGRDAASDAAELADRLGQAWLARLARAILGIGDAGVRREAASALAASEREGDRWGCALAGLALGHSLAYSGHADAASVLTRSSADLRALGATVLEAWAAGLAAFALARADDPGARGAAHAAERAARSAGIRAPLAFTYLALAALEPARRTEYLELAAAMAEECGLVLPGAHAQSAGPRVSLRCLGAFTLTVEGTPVDLSAVRPRARQLLRTLALHGGRPVHREVLQEQLWPDATPESGRRTLQVAISALRAVLPAPLDVVREDEAYRLLLPEDVELDLAQLDDALARARRARIAGDVAGGRGCAAARARPRRRRRRAAGGRPGRVGRRRARAATHAGERRRRVARHLAARARGGRRSRRRLRARARSRSPPRRALAAADRRARAVGRPGAGGAGAARVRAPARDARAGAACDARQSFVKSSISAIEAELFVPLTGG